MKNCQKKVTRMAANVLQALYQFKVQGNFIIPEGQFDSQPGVKKTPDKQQQTYKSPTKRQQ